MLMLTERLHELSVADLGGGTTGARPFYFDIKICQKVLESPPPSGLAPPPTRNPGSARH